MMIGFVRPEAKRLWLLIARVVVILLALYNMLPGVLGVPAHYRRLAALEPWPDRGGWNPVNFSAAVQAAGIAPEVIAWLILIPALMGIFINLSLGLLIYWRQSKDWMGLFTSFVLLSLAGTFAGDNYQFLAALPSFWQLVARQLVALTWLSFILFLLLFPDGRIVNRWHRWLVVVQVFWFVLVQLTVEIWGRTPDPILAIGLVLITLAIVVQVLRYVRFSSPVERQQIRWFVLAISVFTAFNGARNLLEGQFPLPVKPGAPDLWNYLFLHYVSTFTFMLIPASISIAILRYRLWDIDLVIRRTLLYTVLTALLGLLYFGLVTLLQSVLSGATGQTSPLALVISTLAIAALFNPLRRRVQNVIDQRFFRKKYNAEKTMESFNASLRQEMDLNEMNKQMLAVIEETMQPEKVIVWMKSNAKKRQEVGG